MPACTGPAKAGAPVRRGAARVVRNERRAGARAFDRSFPRACSARPGACSADALRATLPTGRDVA
ncbi:MAG TPA: hypothetical protein VK472_06115, partial [Allosphingosinicella sp.]|nr:hypothetical protein [Allosphingosinicella sp.]